MLSKVWAEILSYTQTSTVEKLKFENVEVILSLIP